MKSRPSRREGWLVEGWWRGGVVGWVGKEGGGKGRK